MIRANSEKDLLKILKIISEESVRSARKTLIKESTDPVQGMYMRALENDQLAFKTNLREQEDSAEPQEEQEEIENEEEQETPEDEEEDLNPEMFGTNFESLVKDINSLRAGKSTKNSEIRSELSGYFDRLGEDERRVLHLFVKEVSDILNGVLTGDQAQDPSDPSFSIKIGGNGEEKESKKADSQKPAEDRTEEEENDQTGGSEDTSPPIKVNESQDLREVRKRFRRMIKRL